MSPRWQPSLAGAVVVVCHTQVGGGIGDSQPPEEGVISNHARLVLWFGVLVTSAPSSVVLFLLSAPAVAVLIAVVLAVVVTVLVAALMLVASVVAVALAVVVATVMVVAVVVSVVVALVVALTPPLLLRVRVPPSSPVLFGFLLVTPPPLCLVVTFVLVPVDGRFTSTICSRLVKRQLDRID